MSEKRHGKLTRCGVRGCKTWASIDDMNIVDSTTPSGIHCMITVCDSCYNSMASFGNYNASDFDLHLQPQGGE